MKKLLVIGGSGFLGANWVIHSIPSFEVVFTYNNNFVFIPGAKAFKLCLETDDLIKFLDEINPDIVVNCAGFTNVDECEVNIDKAFLLNATLPEKLSIWCKANTKKIIHISTDHLTSGLEKNVDESVSVSPLNVYSKSKAAGEKSVLSQCENALVLRTCFFGWGPSFNPSFSDKLIRSLKGGEIFYAVKDVFFSPVYVGTLIEVAHKLLKLGKTGLVNVGSERISKLDFCNDLLKQYSGTKCNIAEAIKPGAKSKIPRPRDMSLDSKRLVTLLGCNPLVIKHEINKMLSDINVKQNISKLGAVIPYGKHFVDDADVLAVSEVVKNGPLTQGHYVDRLEREIASYVGAKYAVAVSSATAGLHISYKALGLSFGEKIATSAVTFVSTANAAHYCGATVKFVDIDPVTLNMNAKCLRANIIDDEKVRIVANVLFGGCALGADEIYEIARSQNCFVVEDAAHALGSKYPCGAKVGSCKYSDSTVFSLHPVKSIAAGEGGVITTNDSKLYQKLLRLRSHGINKVNDDFMNHQLAFEDGAPNLWYYEMQELGYHYRITDIQCALASSQLIKLDEFLKRRRELASRYVRIFADVNEITPVQKHSIANSANHLFVVRIDFKKLGLKRNAVMHRLRAKNIITQVHYIPIPMHPYYRGLGHTMKDLACAGEYYKEALSLPLYYSLSDDEQDFVAEALLSAIR